MSTKQYTKMLKINNIYLVCYNQDIQITNRVGNSSPPSTLVIECTWTLFRYHSVIITHSNYILVLNHTYMDIIHIYIFRLVISAYIC